MRPIGQRPANYRLARAAFFRFFNLWLQRPDGRPAARHGGHFGFSGVSQGGRDQQERTGRFWSRGGGEAILAPRTLRLSQDDRGDNFLLHRKLRPAA